MSGKRKQDYPCLKCNNHVKKNDQALQCALCDLWVHLKCTVPVMSLETFNVLVSQAAHNGGTFWCCISCRNFKAKIDKRLSVLEKWSDKVDGDVQENTGKIADLEKQVKEIKTNALKTTPADAQAIKDDTSQAVFNELEEREKRKCNIVVHGLREADVGVKDGKERKSYDLTLLQNLVDTVELEIQVAESLRYSKRLGEQTNDVTKPRPLLMSFKSVNDKISLLDKAVKLKDEDDWKFVSLVQDLTKTQRQQEQSLRDQRDKKNAERSDDDAKNWEWKIVGRRGERRIVKKELVQEE